MMATHEEYYQALIEKNSEYEGLFYVGVKTTDVFCRPTCPARKPKFENCEFFETTQQALLAGFRPCKRCRPLSHSTHVSDFLQQLVEAVETHPERKWQSVDVREFYIDPSTARRQFKKRFGMTFVQYARARRIGLAMKQIKDGATVIDAQVTAGYESGSGFREAFARIMGRVPSLAGQKRILGATWFDTKLGPMVAIADENVLYLLEFGDRQGVERQIEHLREKTKAAIIPGRTAPIDQVEAELHRYFAGDLKEFKTPITHFGTPFQRLVWDTLESIPFGKTRSYFELAVAIGKPSAVRAVAQANGANQFAIIVPCHRIICASGDPGGYGGGLTRKKWLLHHEKSGA